MAPQWRAAAAIQAAAKKRAWVALIWAALISRGSLASSQSIGQLALGAGARRGVRQFASQEAGGYSVNFKSFTLLDFNGPKDLQAWLAANT